MNTANPASRLARFLILVSNYEFDIEYHPREAEEPDVEIDPPGFQINVLILGESRPSDTQEKNRVIAWLRKNHRTVHCVIILS